MGRMRLVATFLAGVGATTACEPPVAAQGTPSALQIDLPTAVRLADERNLDVAIYLDEERPMVSAGFCREDLQVLVELGVNLNVSDYLSSDDPSDA